MGCATSRLVYIISRVNATLSHMCHYERHIWVQVLYLAYCKTHGPIACTLARNGSAQQRFPVILGILYIPDWTGLELGTVIGTFCPVSFFFLFSIGFLSFVFYLFFLFLFLFLVMYYFKKGAKICIAHEHFLKIMRTIVYLFMNFSKMYEHLRKYSEHYF